MKKLTKFESFLVGLFGIWMFISYGIGAYMVSDFIWSLFKIENSALNYITIISFSSLGLYFLEKILKKE